MFERYLLTSIGAPLLQLIMIYVLRRFINLVNGDWNSVVLRHIDIRATTAPKAYPNEILIVWWKYENKYLSTPLNI